MTKKKISRELISMYKLGYSVMALATIQACITEELSPRQILRIDKAVRNIVDKEIKELRNK